jgi:hypothetical protein
MERKIEDMCGYLKKKKGNSFCRIFGNTNLRWFELIHKNKTFGYKGKKTDSKYKKENTFKEITDYIENVPKEEKSTCDWKFGFQVFINNKRYILFAQTDGELKKWTIAFNIVLQKGPKELPMLKESIFRFALETFEKPYFEELKRKKQEEETLRRKKEQEAFLKRKKEEEERQKREEEIKRRKEVEQKQKEEEEEKNRLEEIVRQEEVKKREEENIIRQRQKREEILKLVEIEKNKIKEQKKNAILYDLQHESIILEADERLIQAIQDEDIVNEDTLNKSLNASFNKGMNGSFINYKDDIEDWNYYDDCNQPIPEKELIKFNPIAKETHKHLFVEKTNDNCERDEIKTLLKPEGMLIPSNVRINIIGTCETDITTSKKRDKIRTKVIKPNLKLEEMTQNKTLNCIDISNTTNISICNNTLVNTSRLEIAPISVCQIEITPYKKQGDTPSNVDVDNSLYLQIPNRIPIVNKGKGESNSNVIKYKKPKNFKKIQNDVIKTKENDQKLVEKFKNEDKNHTNPNLAKALIGVPGEVYEKTKIFKTIKKISEITNDQVNIESKITARNEPAKKKHMKKNYNNYLTNFNVKLNEDSFDDNDNDNKNNDVNHKQQIVNYNTNQSDDNIKDYYQHRLNNSTIQMNNNKLKLNLDESFNNSFLNNDKKNYSINYKGEDESGGSGSDISFSNDGGFTPTGNRHIILGNLEDSFNKNYVGKDEYSGNNKLDISFEEDEKSELPIHTPVKVSVPVSVPVQQYLNNDDDEEFIPPKINTRSSQSKIRRSIFDDGFEGKDEFDLVLEKKIISKPKQSLTENKIPSYTISSNTHIPMPDSMAHLKSSKTIKETPPVITKLNTNSDPNQNTNLISNFKQYTPSKQEENSINTKIQTDDNEQINPHEYSFDMKSKAIITATDTIKSKERDSNVNLNSSFVEDFIDDWN